MMHEPLAAAFLSECLDASREVAALSSALAALVDAARAAWPSVRLAPELFVRHLARALPAGGKLPEEREATELYLACACLAGDRHALKLFSDHYLARLGPLLARIDPSPAFSEEVIALLRERLLLGEQGDAPKLAEYRGQGALAGWLRITATRIALRLKKRTQARAQKEGDGARSAEGALSQLSPELEHLKRRYRPAFEGALRDALPALSERSRKVLRLSYVEGKSIDAIGDLLGVHRATAARWIASARQELLAKTRALLQDRLRVADPELDSLIGLVASQLEVTLGGLGGAEQV